MLERVNGANAASLKSNSTYVSKSGTTIKSVSDNKPEMNEVSGKLKQDGKEAKATQNDSTARPDEEQIKEVLEKINMDDRFRRTGCEFTYHEVSDRISVTLYDKETKEVIREIPPEDTIKMLDKLNEIAGLIIDEKM